MNIEQAYAKCKKRLSALDDTDTAFEALSLMNKACGITRTDIIAHGTREIEDEKLSLLYSLVDRRLKNEPLQYILGCWSFCGFDFFVGTGVLIPRDDTEVVVNLCLDFLKDRESKKTLDLCSGSGAIAVALSKLANTEVTGVELSDTAFEYLTKNIAHNNANVKAVKGDILKCHKDFTDNEYDLIVSNPPYIKSEDIPNLQKEVLKEPVMALDGGESGFDFYEQIIKHWTAKLKNGGALAFELGEEQADYVGNLMHEAGFTDIRTELDFGNTQRAIIGTLCKI